MAVAAVEAHQADERAVVGDHRQANWEFSTSVQQELMRMRAVPFSNLNERLYRVVRQTAREVDKKAELEIEGRLVEIASTSAWRLRSTGTPVYGCPLFDRHSECHEGVRQCSR